MLSIIIAIVVPPIKAREEPINILLIVINDREITVPIVNDTVDAATPIKNKITMNLMHRIKNLDNPFIKEYDFSWCFTSTTSSFSFEFLVSFLFLLDDICLNIEF